jgi:hypothetical protein
MSQFAMPAVLFSALETNLGIDIATGLQQNWMLLTLSSAIGGIIVVIHAMNSVYKSYKYNRYDLRNGAILKFVTGIMLVNINWVILAMVQFVK